MLHALIVLTALLACGQAVAEPIQGFITPANDGSTATDGRILRFDATTGQFNAVLSPAQGVRQINGMTYGPDGNLYAAYWNASSNSDGRILKVAPDGTTSTFVPAGLGGLQTPVGLAFGPDGNLYVAGNQGSVLRYSGSTGAFLGTFASSGLSIPQDMLFGADGRLYVSNGAGDSVSRYDGQTGAFLGYLVAPGAFGLDAPVGMTMGPNGDLFVASFPTNRIFRFNPATGTLISVFDLLGVADGLDALLDLAFGPDESLYASVRRDSTGTDFIRLNPDTGNLLGTFAHMDRPNAFNTGMLFVDSRCASLGSVTGQASSCFVAEPLPEPASWALVLIGCLGLGAAWRRGSHGRALA